MRYFVISLFLSTLLLNAAGQNVYALAAQASLCTSAEKNAYTIPAELTPYEKKWFVRFQEGYLLVHGWQDIMETILKKTPADQVEQQKKFLEQLGNKIGLEWCKEESVRKVDTDMLRTWGNQIRQAADTDEKHLQGVLASIDKQVDTLLN